LQFVFQLRFLGLYISWWKSNPSFDYSGDSARNSNIPWEGKGVKSPPLLYCLCGNQRKQPQRHGDTEKKERKLYILTFSKSRALNTDQKFRMKNAEYRKCGFS